MTFRKPKFMRNDELMHVYIDAIDKLISDMGGVNTDDKNAELKKLFYAKTIWNCMKKAAKAGGYFTVGGFVEDAMK